ncbi:type II 3-dehydroquinate dehydratase, partial [Candidatus Poribacteria bacterium]|nr:type II 3-dehydroquinate dehydratase [Candidatus Poribacteria bacterium]
AVNLPVIEIHLSNIYARESFRHHSYISAIAIGVIGGFGAYSYDLALDAMIHILKQPNS